MGERGVDGRPGVGGGAFPGVRREEGVERRGFRRGGENDFECGVGLALGVPGGGDLVEECCFFGALGEAFFVSCFVDSGSRLKIRVFGELSEGVVAVGVKNYFNNLFARIPED
ncbi:hypothetical protein [Nocardiopsis ansamitocini]|uniref:hypothetical protein n=1 Tax=Nocardiopsis ansamitocini TaxID=1670832 RepID=UPI0025524D2E|nr:hypothetical protein [Nocardiopsis ansamitocini]